MRLSAANVAEFAWSRALVLLRPLSCDSGKHGDISSEHSCGSGDFNVDKITGTRGTFGTHSAGTYGASHAGSSICRGNMEIGSVNAQTLQCGRAGRADVRIDGNASGACKRIEQGGHGGLLQRRWWIAVPRSGGLWNWYGDREGDMGFAPLGHFGWGIGEGIEQRLCRGFEERVGGDVGKVEEVCTESHVGGFGVGVESGERRAEGGKRRDEG